MIYIFLTYLAFPFLWFAQKKKTNKAICRIALIQTAKIGDMLCATPIISALRKHYPEAVLHVLHASITREIIDGLPEIDQCITLDLKNSHRLRGKLFIARLLRQGNYDFVVNISPSLPILLGLIWANIPHLSTIMPTRMGSTLKAISPFLDDYEQHKTGELVLHTLQRLLERRGISLSSQKKMVSLLSGETICNQLGINSHNHPIGIAISSGNKLKELGEEKLLALISRLLQQGNTQIVLIGTEDDRTLGKCITRQLGEPKSLINAAGNFRLPELPSLMKRLSVFVGIDSGLSYLADTFDVPIVSVIGPMDYREQRPMGKNTRLIVRRPTCYPCVSIFNTPYFCKMGTRECITKISADDIIDQLNSIRQYPSADMNNISPSCN